MEPCYSKVSLLQERLQELQSRFRFPHVDLVVQRTQNYMQEVGMAVPAGEEAARGGAGQPGQPGPGLVIALGEHWPSLSRQPASPSFPVEGQDRNLLGKPRGPN